MHHLTGRNSSHDELYEVQANINHHGQPKKKKVKTLVRWKGYGPEVDAWFKPEKFTDPDLSWNTGIGWVNKIFKARLMQTTHHLSVKLKAIILPLGVANALDSNLLQCCL